MSTGKTSLSRIKSIIIIDDDDLFLTLVKTFCTKLIPQAKIELYNPLTLGRPGDDFMWTRYDLLFLDYNLGKGENGLDWLRSFRGRNGFPATIMMTGEGDEELAVEAMRCGAQYYMNKSKISIERLEQVIGNVQVKPDRQEAATTGTITHTDREQHPPLADGSPDAGDQASADTSGHASPQVSTGAAGTMHDAEVPAPGPEKDEAAKKEKAPAPKGPARKDDGRIIDLPDAIKNNRIQTFYRPFLALSDSASQFEADLFQLRVKVLDVNDLIVPQEEVKMVKFKAGNPAMLDLWVVRFALSQLLTMHKAQGARKSGLFIRLFEESLANNKLYDWMKSLLTKIKTANIASTIIFEINPPAFLKHKDNAMNFINQMRDSWGTGFALYDVANTGVFDTCQKQAGFEFLEVSLPQKDRDLIGSLAETARESGALTILENIGNPEELNMAIEDKFDYGQGEFIQPAMDKLDFSTDVIEI